MDEKLHNPPAFPTDGRTQHGTDYDGMTLRDYFAGRALAGLLAVGENFHDDEVDGWKWYARASYAMADAMLSARHD